jgi:hypothetical protein
MTAKTFLKAVTNSKADVLQMMLDILGETGSSYCVVGGLAVNAYVEPVVSLDFDIVVAGQSLDKVCGMAAKKGFKIEKYEHSINLSKTGSDLRIQIQTDARYQEFIPRARARNVLGYKMRVAALEDVLSGKSWAYRDSKRRQSKRQKDIADIIRIVESYPALRRQLPSEIRKLAN